MRGLLSLLLVNGDCRLFCLINCRGYTTKNVECLFRKSGVSNAAGVPQPDESTCEPPFVLQLGILLLCVHIKTALVVTDSLRIKIHVGSIRRPSGRGLRYTVSLLINPHQAVYNYYIDISTFLRYQPDVWARQVPEEFRLALAL